MTDKNKEIAVEDNILNSSTASEEDVAEYMKTLSPEEREAYIDYMISENKEIARQEWEKDAVTIAEMNMKEQQKKVQQFHQAVPDEHSSTPDTTVIQNAEISVAEQENQNEEKPLIFETPTTNENTSPSINNFGISEEEQKTLDAMKKKKKSSHWMLYTVLGCFIFLVILIIIAKILLSPTVTVAIR